MTLAVETASGEASAFSCAQTSEMVCHSTASVADRKAKWTHGPECGTASYFLLHYRLPPPCNMRTGPQTRKDSSTDSPPDKAWPPCSACDIDRTNANTRDTLSGQVECWQVDQAEAQAGLLIKPRHKSSLRIGCGQAWRQAPST